MQLMRHVLVSLLLGGVGCRQASRVPPSSNTPSPELETTPADTPEPTPSPSPASGLRLVVMGAPAGATLTVEASDSRPALVRPRSLEPDEQLDLAPGFVTITLRSEDDTRVLQLYFLPGAKLRYHWDDPASTQSDGVRWLDRAAVEREAKEDFDALMAVVSDDGALHAALQAQREVIDALGDDDRAHLRRLFHATNVIQIQDRVAAWFVIEDIPPDSIAWAAYSSRFVELRALFGDFADAQELFAEVRERVPDLGLATAFAAGDLLAAERTVDPDAVAEAYIAASTVTGPPVVGRPMPAFELFGVDGRRPIRSQDLAGTPYLVELWSTWCKPCLEQMKELHDLHEELGTGDAPALRIISISVNDTRSAPLTFRAQHWPMPWANAWAPGGEPVFSAWSVGSVPFAVLVDADGTVLRAGPDVSLDEVRAAIR